MAANIIGKGKIVLEYFKKFPGLSKKALANKIYQDNPLVFKNPEDTRAMIRYYAGAAGQKKPKAFRQIQENNFFHP